MHSRYLKDAMVEMQRNVRIIVYRIAPVTVSGLQSMLSLKMCHGAWCGIYTIISQWVHDTHSLGKQGQQQRSEGQSAPASPVHHTESRLPLA